MSQPSSDAGELPAASRGPVPWRFKVAPENRELIPYYWAYAVSLTIEVATIPLALVLLVASLAFHLVVPASVVILIIATAMLCMAINQAVRIRLLFHLGRWRGLDGGLARRDDQPGRFRRLVTVHGATLLAALAAGVFLTWTAVSSWP